eukprot:XP_001179708.2 PREDICTED: beta-1,3-galactosyltransferase 1-like isoform X2 [Strongylocentrotus purpuratus]
MNVRKKVVYRTLFYLCTAYLICRIIASYLIWGRYGSDFLSQIVIFSQDPNSSKDRQILLGNQADISQSLPAINPHPYKFLINEPNKCQNEDGRSKLVFLLVLVATIHKNVGHRKTIRETWGSPGEINGNNIITLFLLAKPSKGNTEYQRIVEEESASYHDIIMSDFQDSYKNLTLKTIMGMKWVSQFCPHANYVMKTDDDMIVIYENLFRYLSSTSIPRNNFVSCIVIRAKPNRIVGHRWHVPKSIYPGEWYPPFCSGAGYVMSGDVARNVYTISLHTPFLYLEDVYMGLCLFQLGVYPSAHRQFHNYRVEYSTCGYKKLFTTHYSIAKNSVRYNVWSQMERDKQIHCYFNFW